MPAILRTLRPAPRARQQRPSEVNRPAPVARVRQKGTTHAGLLMLLGLGVSSGVIYFLLLAYAALKGWL